MGDITKNFSWREFNHSASAPNYEIPRTRKNEFIITRLCEDILQPIRDHVGKSVKSNSGIRDLVIYEALKRRGYPASRTSDHFAWSEANPIGSGASDFTWSGFEKNGHEVFQWIINHIKFNQAIIYPESNFIHISNPRNRIFQLDIPSRRPVLEYKNKKYIPYKKEN